MKLVQIIVAQGEKYKFSAFERNIINGDIDEPESGLSDFERKHCIKVSKQKAKRGRKRVFKNVYVKSVSIITKMQNIKKVTQKVRM